MVAMALKKVDVHVLGTVEGELMIQHVEALVVGICDVRSKCTRVVHDVHRLPTSLRTPRRPV